MSEPNRIFNGKYGVDTLPRDLAFLHVTFSPDEMCASIQEFHQDNTTHKHPWTGNENAAQQMNVQYFISIGNS